MPTDEIIELDVDAMVHGGKVMGRHAGRPVFVTYAVPGERVRARITEAKRNFAQAEMVEVLKPSPDRVTPRCPHYGTGHCGGCQLQHMSYAAQLRYKRDVVLDQLTRIGKVRNVESLVRETIASPEPWGYRTRADFHRAPDGGLGFVSTEPPRVEPVETCHILAPAAMALLDELDLDDETITEVRVQVDSAGQGMFVISTSDDLAPELAVDVPVSINLLLSDNEPVNLIGASHALYDVRGRRFRATAGSFFQVNLPQAGTLVDLVLEWANPTADDAVLDLYAGVGLFTAFLAERAALVTAIESYPPAVTDADENLAEFDNVDLFEGGVGPVLEGLLDEEAGPYAAAVVDPPRAGLDVDVLDALGAFAPPTLVYVSCDPATLARDVQRLGERHGYRLLAVQPVDMFPQTYHIECVAQLVRT
ncbi:MAG: class I SAM-dependent RNA methyltransferase [Anaerolineae bacterium]|nr:class I SAM-dependent RNA methyltransferase [Anaerolineae bacterium]